MEENKSVCAADRLCITFRSRSGVHQAVKDFSFSLERGGTLAVVGQSGSGKTHICTAVCTGLMEEKGKEADFMPWRDEARTLKAGGDPVRCDQRIKRLQQVAVLYIDDLFKGGASEADLRLAFEILNGRYNNARLRTVISSELDLEAILRLDEAVGGRIYERSRGFTVRAPHENRRLRA